MTMNAEQEALDQFLRQNDSSTSPTSETTRLYAGDIAYFVRMLPGGYALPMKARVLSIGVRKVKIRTQCADGLGMEEIWVEPHLLIARG